MKNIIPPIDKQKICAELDKVTQLQCNNYQGHLTYIFRNDESPILMEEIGRLREITFRHAGGGTGKAVDIDEYDTNEKPFTQLIIWNPKSKEIMGGYRYLIGPDITIKDGIMQTPTGELFKGSDAFYKTIVPRMLELGRSFVIPDYQASGSTRKGIFVLENLWIGLGAVAMKHSDIDYFFGKFTMYTTYNTLARDFLLNFLYKYFPQDNETPCTPFEQIKFLTPQNTLDEPFLWNDYKSDYKTLNALVKSLHEVIPPLVNSYMNLSPTMQVYGTCINHHFGDVEETGILIKISDIIEDKLLRYGLIDKKRK